MKMFRERNPVPLGLIVVSWLAAAVLLVLNINTLVGMFGREYHAEIAEAAGLKQGDPVRVSGLDVGRVSAVELGDRGVLVTFTVNERDIELGDQTSASVGVETVLGDKALVLRSQGSQPLASGATIPLERTTAPYDVTAVLSTLTTETGQIDVDEVSKALDSVSATLDQASPELRTAVRGIGRLSKTISTRDQTLRSLLNHATGFSKVLADRSQDVTQMVRAGNLLFAELLARRQDVKTLLTNVTAMARQLTGLVDDNSSTLGPALDELNAVVKVLRANKTNLSKALKGLSVYATSLGEVVASGPFFTAYLQNLLPGNLIPPIVDLPGLRPEGAAR